MAETKSEAKAPAPAKPAMKYYRNTRHAGSRYMVSFHEDDSTQNVYVRFMPVREKFQGDNVSVGYMAIETDMKDYRGNPVFERVARSNGVEEITQKDYEAAVPGAKG